MTLQETLEAYCKLQGTVMDHVGYEHPADCFCKKGGLWNIVGYDPDRMFQNDGVVFNFIETAVKEKIERDSCSPSPTQPSNSSGPSNPPENCELPTES